MRGDQKRKKEKEKDMCLKYFGGTSLGFGMVPTAIGILYFAEMGLVYFVATVSGDTNSTLPFITSAADQRPQSCLFSMCSNLVSLFLFMFVFVRHRQCQAFYTVDQFWNVGTLYVRDMILWNNVSRWCGTIGAAGWFIIANVQESGIYLLHSIGAHAAYGGFVFYMIFQVFFACNISRSEQRKSAYYFRCALTVLAILFFSSYVFFEIKISYDASDSDHHVRNFHQAAVAAEWSTVFCQMVFFMSYYVELEKVKLKYGLMSEYVDIETVRAVRENYNHNRGRYRI